MVVKQKKKKKKQETTPGTRLEVLTCPSEGGPTVIEIIF